MARYQIVLKNQTDGEVTSEVIPKATSEMAPQEAESGSSVKSVAKQLSSVIGKVGTVLAVANTAKNIVLRNVGNTDITDRVNASIDIASNIVQTGIAFAINPSLGIASVSMQALNYINQVEQYNYNKTWEAIELQQKRTELGSSFNRSRKGR